MPLQAKTVSANQSAELTEIESHLGGKHSLEGAEEDPSHDDTGEIKSSGL